MTDVTIPCPECGANIPLNEALAGPLIDAERKKLQDAAVRQLEAERQAIAKKAAAEVSQEFEVRLKNAESTIADRETKLRSAQAAELAARKSREEAEQAKRDVELTVQRRIDEQKAAVAKKATEEATKAFQAKLREADDAIAERDARLKEAEAGELEARKLRAEAEEAKRTAELTVQRRLDEEREKIREAVVRERDGEARLKLAEKDKQLDDMRTQIEELRRKGNSGSQQLQGDVLELDLLDVLQAAFPGDRFERVKKGQRGADVLQYVIAPNGQQAGSIFWETKRTKTWSDQWLPKLREDQREAKADLVALASETLPEGLQHFDRIDGVWVTSLSTATALSAALRHGLIQTAQARRALVGADQKKDQAYGYLTGQDFRQRVTGMLEPLMELRTDLDREKRLLTRQWSTREKQLERLGLNMAAMYGDLHGIVGGSLPEIDGLTLPQLEAGDGSVPDLPQLSGGDEVGDSSPAEVH
jgi:hypothetical protein